MSCSRALDSIGIWTKESISYKWSLHWLTSCTTETDVVFIDFLIFYLKWKERTALETKRNIYICFYNNDID